MIDIGQYIDKFENLELLSRETIYGESICARFNHREIREMLILLRSMKEIEKEARAKNG